MSGDETSAPTKYRRVVTAVIDGRSVVKSDEELAAYASSPSRPHRVVPSAPAS
jgi:hypothetical protein